MVVLLINAAAVLFMTGFIWTMQLLHYPLLDRVGTDAFPRYETDHNRLFVLIAGPGVLLTLVSGVALLFVRPSGVPLWLVLAGLLLLAMIVVSTARFQAPLHAKLSHGFDRDAYAFLLRTNWVRTVAWSLYALLTLWMLWLAA